VQWARLPAAHSHWQGAVVLLSAAVEHAPRKCMHAITMGSLLDKSKIRWRMGLSPPARTARPLAVRYVSGGHSTLLVSWSSGKNARQAAVVRRLAAQIFTASGFGRA